MVIEASPRRAAAKGCATLFRIGALASALALTGAAAQPAAPALPTPPADGVMGFVLDGFAPAIALGKDDCPEGLAKTIRENYLQSLVSPERMRLMLAANEPELTRKWKAYALGPNNTNVCSNPELFDHPLQQTIQGKIAPGLNLDGDTSGAQAAGGCAHANFTSPSGERGIDNQAYRALGCSRSYRSAAVGGSVGDIVQGLNNFLASGEHTMVLQLRGVDSFVNDPDVTIVFATTGDAPVLDSKRGFVAGASFRVSDNPRWRNVLHGRIVNGVLITDPTDVHLTRRLGVGGVPGEKFEWDLRAARLRLAFQPDGTLKGLLGAYQPVRNLIGMTILGGVGAATVAGIDCASQLTTLRKLADGLRDPKTGQCSGISSAMDVSAVPAFVIDRPAAIPAATN